VVSANSVRFAVMSVVMSPLPTTTMSVVAVASVDGVDAEVPRTVTTR